jgi:hypothetical protein
MVLFGIVAWAAVQLAVNLADDYIAGRSVTIVAPVHIGTSDVGNVQGMKLAQILSADLSAIAVSAERSLPSDAEFKSFRASQAFKQLPDGTEDTKGGLDTIFSTTRIGNAPVVDSLNLDASTKFQVSGTDLTPYISWLINRFRKHNALELTLLDLKPGRKVIWNVDTARSSWDTMTLDSQTDEAAIDEFTWTYAHLLAARSQNASAFKTLSGQQYRTIVRAYALYADAIRAAGIDPDRDMRSVFGRILTLLETGVDSGASGQAAPSGAPVKEVTAQWWELSKSFAVIASLAGQQKAAVTYAEQALALLNGVTENKPDKTVISALKAVASGVTPSKPTQPTEKPDRSAVIFLTATPLPTITPNEAVTDKDNEVRTTGIGQIDLFELKQPITGAVSALEAVQLPSLPAKARLVLNLPLEILNSPALPKLISDDLDPSQTVIYTRADAKAAGDLQKKYSGATVHREGMLTPDKIRETEISPS